MFLSSRRLVLARQISVAVGTALLLAWLVYSWRKAGSSLLIWDDGEYWLEDVGLYKIFQENGLRALLGKLFWGNMGRPTLLPALGAPFLFFASRSINNANLLFTTSFTFALVFSVSLFFQRAIRPAWLGLLAGWFLCSHSLFFQAFTRFMTELPYLAFVAAAAAAFSFTGAGPAALSGLMAGLAICVRPFEAVILIGILAAADFVFFPEKPRARQLLRNLFFCLFLPLSLAGAWGLLCYLPPTEGMQIYRSLLFFLIGEGVILLSAWKLFAGRARAWAAFSLSVPFLWLLPRVPDLFGWSTSNSSTAHVFTGFYPLLRGAVEYFGASLLVFGVFSVPLLFLGAFWGLRRGQLRLLTLGVVQLLIPLLLLYLFGGEAARGMFSRFFLLNLALFYGICFYLIAGRKASLWCGGAIMLTLTALNFYALIGGIFFTQARLSFIELEHREAYGNVLPAFGIPIEQRVISKLETWVPETRAKFALIVPELWEPRAIDRTAADLVAFERSLPWDFRNYLEYASALEVTESSDYLLAGPLHKVPAQSPENMLPARAMPGIKGAIPIRLISTFFIEAGSPTGRFAGWFALYKVER